MIAIDAELARGRALVAAVRTGLELVSCDPQPTPADIGALGGLGLALEQPALRVNVYVFDGWNAGASAGEQLHELVDGGPYRAVTAINGALLLFALAESDRDDLLRQIVDAFHGDG